MMLKEKSSPWARLKYLYVLPLAVVTVTAFARPEISEKANEISAVKVNDLAAIVETKLAETIFVSVDSVRPLPPPPAKMKKEKVSRDTLNVVVLKDVDVEVANPTIFLNSAKITSTADGKKTMVSDHQVVIGGDKVKFVDKANSMIGEAGQVTVMGAKGKIISSSLDSVLIYIDNRESTAKELEAFDASAICSVSVLKDAATITKYGTKGKNGVVLVTTQRESDKKKAIYGHMRDIQLSGKNITMHGGEELPMDMDKNSYYIDDKPSTPTEVRILMNNSSDREIVEVGSSENAEATGGYKIRIRTEKKGTSNEKIKVTGKVVDQKGAPIAGALIQVNGSTKGGTLSDKKGAFSLTVTRSARLTILAVDKAIQQSTRVSSEPMQIVLQDAK